jgi:hypothetical protein
MRGISEPPHQGVYAQIRDIGFDLKAGIAG